MQATLRWHIKGLWICYFRDLTLLACLVHCLSDVPTFTVVQFSTSGAFLLLVVAISLALGFDDVATARLGQSLNALAVSTTFYLGWKLLPSVLATHSVPEGKWMLTHFRKTGIQPNRSTEKACAGSVQSFLERPQPINLLFFLSSSWTSNWICLARRLVGLFFLALIGMVPGVTIIGSLSLSKDNVFPWSFVRGFLIGVFYPTEVHSNEQRRINVGRWLPPFIIFSLLAEANVSQGIGVMCISSFFLVAFWSLFLQSCLSFWGWQATATER